MGQTLLGAWHLPRPPVLLVGRHVLPILVTGPLGQSSSAPELARESCRPHNLLFVFCYQVRPGAGSRDRFITLNTNFLLQKTYPKVPAPVSELRGYLECLQFEVLQGGVGVGAGAGGLA